MQEYPVWMGALILIGLIGMKYGLREFRHIRLKTWWRRVNEAMKNGDYDQAVKALRKCLALEPLFVPARILIGTVLAMTNQPKEAEDQLKMAAELEPRQPEGHLQLGLFYAAHHPEDPEKALDELAIALELAPAYGEKLDKAPHLQRLREQARFVELLAKAKAQADQA